MDWLLPLVIVTALIDSINPCAISVLLLSIAFLASLKKEKKEILISGTLYIVAVGITYVLIGLGILHILTAFGRANLMQQVGAWIVIAVGVIGIIGELVPKFPIKLKIPQGAHPVIARVIHVGTYPAALILGALVALFEFPCTGGPYLFILTMLQSNETWLSGLGYLIIYNIIFVLPLVVILLFAGNTRVLGWYARLKGRDSKGFRITMNVLLILLGILILYLALTQGETCEVRNVLN